MAYTPLELTGKTAVVIGGTSGIGKSISLGMADAGADVVASSRRLAEVQATAAEIRAKGRKSLEAASDVADRSTLEALLDAVVKEFGKVDILVNCAGRTKRAPTLDFPDEDWSAILDTNLTGTLRACQVFGRHMLERGYGRIVNIASLSSFVALFEVAAYAASKAAVASLTKSLAVEWGPKGVLVNAIAPGVFPTPLNAKLLDGTPRGQEFLLRTPLRRFGKTEELAGAAIFLASDAASYVNGEIIAVDGGFLASGVNQ
jgi:NAD(P)-dependent dehydrogenase (short-subunit alcohol dehydrogenase family)